MKLLDSAAQVFMNKQHRSEISRHSKVTELPLWLNVLFNGWGRYNKFKRQAHFSWENRITERWQEFYLKWTCTYIFFSSVIVTTATSFWISFLFLGELTKHYHLPWINCFIPTSLMRDSGIFTALWAPVEEGSFFLSFLMNAIFLLNINLRVGSFFLLVEAEQENIVTEIGEGCRTGKKKISFFFFSWVCHVGW